MKQSDFITHIIASDSTINAKQAKNAYSAMIEAMFNALKRKETVRLNKIGSLSVTVRKETTYRNPRTKELIKKPAHNRIKFSISDIMKEDLNQ